MKGYELDSKSVFKILMAKGITSFHHVNTIGTSCTFIQNNALLSRAFVESNNFSQTYQDSDAIDKKYGVWDDVFIDGLDLHEHFKRNSPYGPIMFKIDLKILTLPDFKEIFITKDNPTNWYKTKTWDERYYKNLNEFDREYRNGARVRDGQIMFTFKNPIVKIRLNKFCSEIIVDDPQIFSKDKTKSLGTVAINRITTELNNNHLGHIPVSLRHLGNVPFCWCIKNYSQMRFFNKDKLKMLFGLTN